MMARDASQFPSAVGAPLQLLSEFIKLGKPMGDANYAKYQAEVRHLFVYIQVENARVQVQTVLEEWRADCERRKQRRIICDLTEHNISTPYLALVTLDYIIARSPTKNKAMQAELLQLGILQTLVAKGL